MRWISICLNMAVDQHLQWARSQLGAFKGFSINKTYVPLCKWFFSGSAIDCYICESVCHVELNPWNFKRINYSSKKYSLYQGQKESARSAGISQANWNCSSRRQNWNLCQGRCKRKNHVGKPEWLETLLPHIHLLREMLQSWWRTERQRHHKVAMSASHKAWARSPYMGRLAPHLPPSCS